MIIGGLQKTTLIDFPGKVACTVFTVGCNFRCPFCHNKDLVTQQLFQKSKIEPIKETDFFKFLNKRKDILDGVCLTGGEPTMQAGLIEFCRQIKKLKLKVKLDTNGTNPVLVRKLIDRKLIDFIAMDIKSNLADYNKAIKINYPINKIKQTIKLIFQSKLEYEFRTTVVPTIHRQENLVKLAQELKAVGEKNNVPASKINYILQTFRAQNCFNPELLKLQPYTDEEMEELLKAVKKFLPKAKLRGN